MTEAARHCESNLAPPPLPAEILRARRSVPCAVAGGGERDNDVFLPPPPLDSAARGTLGVPLEVVTGVGHLLL